MTAAQFSTLRTAILADGVLAAKPHNADSAIEIAVAFNAVASPVFWVWRSAVSRAEIYNNISVDSTNWSWAFYKAQSVTEQNAWTQMFMGDQADFSKANIRAGISNIFTAGATANATHALATGRRQASRAEKLFATGSGTAVSPAVLDFEGVINHQDVLSAMGWSMGW